MKYLSVLATAAATLMTGCVSVHTTHTIGYRTRARAAATTGPAIFGSAVPVGKCVGSELYIQRTSTGLQQNWTCSNGAWTLWNKTTRSAWGETPAGTTDGANLTFTLAHIPNPPLSLQLVVNGLTLKQGVDYTLDGQAIALNQGTTIPQPGQAFTATYQY